MGLQTKPQDDAKAMYDEYVTGVTVDELAQKYGRTNGEVLAMVVKDATPLDAQATEFTREPVAKKDK